jgi:hypothetical protein
MRWEFKQEPGTTHRWRWQCVDPRTGSVLTISQDLFRTLLDCVRNAEVNGYQPAGRPASGEPAEGRRIVRPPE